MRLLGPYSAAQVEAGVDVVLTEYEYKTLPPFSVLNKAIMKASGLFEREDAVALAANAEWENLLDAARKFGRYNKPALDERTERTIRVMGGWDAVCNWQTDALQWKQKEFVENWQRFASHADVMALPAGDILALGQGKSNGPNYHQLKHNGPSHIGTALTGIMGQIGRAS